jgi:hypothetical protein
MWTKKIKDFLWPNLGQKEWNFKQNWITKSWTDVDILYILTGEGADFLWDTLVWGILGIYLLTSLHFS